MEVPGWDYSWQLDYMFTSGVPYTPEDVLCVACDNTAENQPVLSGMRRPVAPVTFGENTPNERCLHRLWLRFRAADYLAANATVPRP